LGNLREAVKLEREAPVKHMDETGWKKASRKRWLRVVATARSVTQFHLLQNRVAAHIQPAAGKAEDVRGVRKASHWNAAGDPISGGLRWPPFFPIRSCPAFLHPTQGSVRG
jgi:hypothetical protein